LCAEACREKKVRCPLCQRMAFGLYQVEDTDDWGCFDCLPPAQVKRMVRQYPGMRSSRKAAKARSTQRKKGS
jgi:hypothetical protein